jgi:hypothetical protein
MKIHSVRATLAWSWRHQRADIVVLGQSLRTVKEATGNHKHRTVNFATTTLVDKIIRSRPKIHPMMGADLPIPQYDWIVWGLHDDETRLLLQAPIMYMSV